jgi:hypothetical protein
MPARDGSGPQGQGARMGRGMGMCQPGAETMLPSKARVWWNPLHWFGGIFRADDGLRRGNRRRLGRGRW